MEFCQVVLGGGLELGTYGDFGSSEAPDADAGEIMHSVLSTSNGYAVLA